MESFTKCSASKTIPLLLLLIWQLILVDDSLGQGIVLPAIGPVNRGMGGAATAAPLDAAGAIQWNPATIANLPGSEMSFAVEMLYSQTRLSSTLPANSFGLGAPPVELSGDTNANTGVRALPTFALVWQPEDSDWTLGLGAMTIGGFGADYAGSTSNPLLTPAPPVGVGFGPVYSRLGIIQIAPTIAKQVTEKVSFGFAPTFVATDLQLDPFFLAAPDDANGDGFSTYPAGTNARLHWGLGFQAGLFVQTDSGINIGVSYKSPQWFETFKFNSTDEIGVPQTLEAETQYPQIISIGASYMLTPRLLIASDLRHIDYESTEIFGDPAGFAPNGAVSGLGWENVFSLSNGVSYQWNDNVVLRAGYGYNQSPIKDAAATVNIATPALYNHALSLGSTINITQSLLMSMSWLHSFDKTISSEIDTPFGAVPGSEVRLRQRNDAFNVGFTVRF